MLKRYTDTRVFCAAFHIGGTIENAGLEKAGVIRMFLFYLLNRLTHHRDFFACV